MEAGDWFSRVARAPRGVTIFAPSDLHLTLAFLGPVDEERAMRAWEALRWPLPPTDVTLGAIVPMGDPRRPSALSAELASGQREIRAAMSACRAAMYDAAGVAHETREALPHVTLARPSRHATSAERDEAVRWGRTLDLGQPMVSLGTAALFTWALDRSVAQFRVVKSRAMPI